MFSRKGQHYYSFFFFQAEDGIRDVAVTGVQTCALPIWHRLPVSVTGDGAGGLVEALAGRYDDGRIGILAWNLTLDQGKIGGDPRLDRLVRLQVAVSDGTGYTVRHYRIDAGHSNIAAAWEQMRRGASWPEDGQWPLLRAMNTLDELCPPVTVAGRPGEPLEFTFDLPMPAVSYLELVP